LSKGRVQSSEVTSPVTSVETRRWFCLSARSQPIHNNFNPSILEICCPQEIASVSANAIFDWEEVEKNETVD
jgi:hypothetical protein